MSAPKKKARPAPKTVATKKTATKKTVARKKKVAPAGKARAADVTRAASEATLTRETLNGTVARAVTLLKAIGTSELIRAAMVEFGYDNEEHERGWTLVHRASGYKPGTIPPPSPPSAVGDAISHIDAADESTLRLVRASLKHRFPTQADFVLKGLTPSKGAKAVVTMRQLLDRLDALETGKGREGTRKDDQAALALLAKRGVSAEFRKGMRAKVQAAETFGEVVVPRATATSREEEHVTDLVELRAWFEEWSEIGRIAIKRKDLLIRMGLAQRKAKAAKGDPLDALEPAPDGDDEPDEP